MASRHENEAPCASCGELLSKVDELQRVINRGANQHADGMDLMREMQVLPLCLVEGAYSANRHHVIVCARGAVSPSLMHLDKVSVGPLLLLDGSKGTTTQCESCSSGSPLSRQTSSSGRKTLLVFSS